MANPSSSGDLGRKLESACGREQAEGPLAAGTDADGSCDAAPMAVADDDAGDSAAAGDET